MHSALDNGIQAANVFKNHSGNIIIWYFIVLLLLLFLLIMIIVGCFINVNNRHHEALEVILLLPLFMKIVGQTELCEELMVICNREYSKLFMYKDFLEKSEKFQLFIPSCSDSISFFLFLLSLFLLLFFFFCYCYYY